MKPHTVNPPQPPMSVTVTTQTELDTALADHAMTEIVIRSERDVWLELDCINDKEVSASGSASVSAYGSASVSASGSASVRASGSARVSASGSASVSAYGSASVSAYDSASVRASGSARVSASGSASVSAYGSASVSASSHVAVHLHSGSCRVDGGVLIDHTIVDQSDPATWCSYHGATVADEHAVLYKAVRQDWRSAHGTSYEPGTTASCEDFRTDGNCGGGLHVSQTPEQASVYDAEATRYVEVRVPLAGINVIGPDKVKAQTMKCVREVDIHGDPIQNDGGS